MLTSRYFDDDRVLAKMCAPRRPLCRNRGIVKKRCDPGCVFRKLFFSFAPVITTTPRLFLSFVSSPPREEEGKAGRGRPRVNLLARSVLCPVPVKLIQQTPPLKRSGTPLQHYSSKIRYYYILLLSFVLYVELDVGKEEEAPGVKDFFPHPIEERRKINVLGG